MRRDLKSLLALVLALVLIAAACGNDDDPAAEGDRPTVVVTTNILGDVVSNLIADQADVVTVMPVGTDPHDFRPSARQVQQIRSADLVISNGASFEEGLLDVLESVEGDGVPVFEAINAVEPLEYGEDGHDHEDEDGHDDHEDGHDDHEDGHEDHEDKDDEDGHDHHHEEGSIDPHFFTDPVRMADVVQALTEFLTENIEELDATALELAAGDYVAELEALSGDVDALLAEIPEDGRVLVTNHEVFGYFGDRYGFEVIGAIIPSGSTSEGASAGALAELAELVEDEGVPAIFADVSSSDELAQTLASEVGDVAVVELFSESLGAEDSEGSSYIEMIRTNAERIAAALAG